MPHAKLVINVGVVDRDVSDHKVGRQQTLEHVDANVSLTADLHGGAASDFQLVERRIDEVLLDGVEVDVILSTERSNDEGAHCLMLLKSLVELSKMIEPEMFDPDFVGECLSDPHEVGDGID